MGHIFLCWPGGRWFHVALGLCLWNGLPSVAENNLKLFPYLIFGLDKPLQLFSTEAVSVWPNMRPQMQLKITVNGC